MQHFKIFLKKKKLIEEFEEWYAEYKVERNRETCQEQYYKNREKRLEYAKQKRAEKFTQSLQERRKNMT